MPRGRAVVSPPVVSLAVKRGIGDTDYEGDSELGDYFSDDEEEHNQIAELGDYFSDDEEDDTLSHHSSNSEEDF